MSNSLIDTFILRSDRFSTTNRGLLSSLAWGVLPNLALTLVTVPLIGLLIYTFSKSCCFWFNCSLFISRAFLSEALGDCSSIVFCTSNFAFLSPSLASSNAISDFWTLISAWVYSSFGIAPLSNSAFFISSCLFASSYSIWDWFTEIVAEAVEVSSFDFESIFSLYCSSASSKSFCDRFISCFKSLSSSTANTWPFST